ncbi:MAG TPA: right-handed parallel beta-helix repeat-containing protein [Candidatus Portnoybacteria bacterium]|nr:right-handed parallel beta-helix repeat-containing protein [Candidatus Portnoybacteria bacterium]
MNKQNRGFVSSVKNAKKGLVFLVAAIIMIGGFFVLFAPPAHAATINVNVACVDTDLETAVCDDGATYRTIQGAIDAAVTGDTVEVAAGIYTEQILIQKDLILTGAGKEATTIKAPAIVRNSAPGYTSTTWSSDNWESDYLLAAYPMALGDSDPTISVKVTGFTFDADNQPGQFSRFTGILFRKVAGSTVADAGLFNSDIKGFASSGSTVTGIRILDGSKLTLDNNTVEKYYMGAISYGTTNLTRPIVNMTNNIFYPNSGNINDDIEYREARAGLISGNTVNYNGMSSSLKYPIVLVSSHGLTVENNILSYAVNGIYIYSNSDSNTISGNTISNCSSNGIYLSNSDSNTISGNTISNVKYSGFGNTIAEVNNGAAGWGIGFDGEYNDGSLIAGTGSNNNTVTGNTVSDSDVAVDVYVGAGNTVNNKNNFSGNFIAVHNNEVALLDATENYWGSATPVWASTISGNITYDPWYADEAMTILSTPEEVYVDDDYKAESAGSHIWGIDAFATIQEGINKVATGGTVNVAAGTYADNLTINKSITINGANAGIAGNASRGSESIVDGGDSGAVVTITADDVTFDGFKVQNSGLTGVEAGIFIQGVSGVNVKNNIVTDNFAGIALAAATLNTVENNALTLNYFGIYVGTDTNPSTGNTIKENDVATTIKTPLGEDKYSGDGIYVDKDCNENIFTDNNVHNNDKDGFYFWKSSNSEVTGNIISGNVAFGIEMKGSSNNAVTDNTITENKDGFHIRNTAEVGYSIIGNNISTNKIYDNTRVNLYTDANQDTNFKAENNWWGSANKTTIESKLAGYGFDLSSETNTTPGTLEYIDFEPYYISNAKDILNTDAVDTVYVDDGYSDNNAGTHSFGYDAFTTIAEGINAVASGGTVNVMAGTYTENLTISKSITILGEDKTTTIIDGNGSGAVVKITANDVALKNFTVQNSGTDILENDGTNGGILVQDATGCTIENNIFTNDLNSVLLLASSSNNVKDNTITGSARYGIVLDYNPLEGDQGTIPSTANTISGNTITLSGRDGIYIGRESDDNIITTNTVSGTVGTDETLVTDNGLEGNGIYFWKSSGNTVTNNTISDNNTNGIEMMGSNNNTITGNSITGNKIGLLARRSDSFVFFPNTFSGNTLTGNTEYAVSTNFTESDGSFIATSNWWGSADYQTIKTKVSNNVDYAPWYVDENKIILSNDVSRKPTITLLSPADGFYSKSETTSHKFKVSDSVDSLISCILHWGEAGSQSFIDVPADSSEFDAGTLTNSDGTTNTWYVTCSDGAGNSGESDHWTFTVDTSAPAEPTIDEVSTPTNISSQTISGTKEANTSVWLNGFEIVSLDGGVNWSYNLSLTEGINEISITTKDAAGNESEAVTSAIIYDTTAPEGTLSINDGAAYTNSSEVTLTVSATDDGSGVKLMAFNNGTGDYSEWEEYATTKTWTLSDNDGAKKVRVKFQDNLGNVTEIGILAEIILDTVAPVITIEPYDDTTPTSQDITVTATADHGSFNENPHTFTENSSFTFIATDLAGNSTSESVEITNIDKEEPVITINGPDVVEIAYGSSYSDAGATATDNHDGSITVISSGVDSVDTSKLGDYTITYNATDSAGNAAVEKTRTVSVVKALLTITANDASKTYGDEKVFAGTEFTATGLQNSDTITSTTIVSSGSDASVFAGSYDIEITDAQGSGLSNYEIAYNKGTLTVNKKALTVTAEANKKTYDGDTVAAAIPVITGTLANSDTAGFIEAYSNANVGTGKTLVPSGIVNDGNDGNNYAVTFVNNTAGIIVAQAPSSFAADSATTNSLALSWTNPNANSNDHYIVKRSASEITAENFDTALTLGGTPIPATGNQGYAVKNLSADTTYYFAIKLVDSLGNTAGISTASGKTLAATDISTDTVAPSAIGDLAAQAGTIATSQIKLTWTATGDDETTGIATKYIIKRSGSTITADNFDAATTVFNSLSPQSAGSAESFTVTGLTSGTTYYFAIKAQDEAGKISDISNIANRTTSSDLPTNTNVNPATGQNDGAVAITVTGTNFVDGANTLRFSNSQNSFDLTATYISATSLTASVPVGTPVGTYSLKVINSNGTSAALLSAYEVTAAPIPPPTVNDVIPSTVGTNDTNINLTIIGSNFTGATSVTINGVALDVLSVDSDTSITGALSGIGVAGSYDVKVTANGTNEMSSVKLTVKAPLIIDSTTLEQTTNDPIDLSTTNTIPVQITLQSDDTIVNTETVGSVEVVIPPATEILKADGTAYTGNINPPQIVKPTEEIIAKAGADAVVITMGNPEEKITFSNDFVTTVTLETTNTAAPLIWYYKPDGTLELAGKAGIKDGVTYAVGGTVLNTVNNGSIYTYTIGILMDHMSSYVAGVNPTISSLSPTASQSGNTITITGTNFSVGATVTFNGATVISSYLNTTSMSAIVPASSVGTYNVAVINTDGLSSNNKTFDIIPVPYNLTSGGSLGGSSGTSMVQPTITAPATEITGQVLGEQTFADGAMIRATNGFDVYIVKYTGNKKFKRLILNPSVFNSYQHLKWADVLNVDQSVIDSFTTSELVRVVGDTRVYKLAPAGDTGTKQWVKTAAAFNNRSFDWDAIYEINATDRNSYITGAEIE